jgi:hypothetical protein
MAKHTPGTLFSALLIKVNDMLEINPREAIGHSYGSLRNFGKELYNRTLQDFFTILIFLLIALALIFALFFFIFMLIFITTKSAYVTPANPQLSELVSFGVTANCTDPSDLGGDISTNPTASRAYSIVSKLLRGFWCFWNKSPEYPNLWNQAKFIANPFPPESYLDGDDLFWCTWLIIKSYSDTHQQICPDCLYVPSMKAWFISKNRFIDASTALSNPSIYIHQGDVAFIKKSGSSRGDNGDHVSMVWEVNRDFISTIDSNNGTKNPKYTITGGVAKWDILSILGFGRL